MSLHLQLLLKLEATVLCWQNIALLCPTTTPLWTPSATTFPHSVTLQDRMPSVCWGTPQLETYPGLGCCLGSQYQGSGTGALTRWMWIFAGLFFSERPNKSKGEVDFPSIHPSMFSRLSGAGLWESYLIRHFQIINITLLWWGNSKGLPEQQKNYLLFACPGSFSRPCIMAVHLLPSRGPSSPELTNFICDLILTFMTPSSKFITIGKCRKVDLPVDPDFCLLAQLLEGY